MTLRSFVRLYRNLGCFVLVGACVAAIPEIALGNGLTIPFQGYLTDSAGKAVADGTRLVQFKLFDAPVGGRLVWGGELHQLSVNAGLVNTRLGSKTSLDGVDFNLPLYLELTVDAQGMDELGAGVIDASDPPLLPRQRVVPAVFARTAAWARDAGKLEGHGWDRILISVEGKGSRLNGDLVAFPDGSVLGDIVGQAGVDGRWLQDYSVGEGKIGSLSRLTLPGEKITDRTNESGEPDVIGLQITEAGDALVRGGVGVGLRSVSEPDSSLPGHGLIHLDGVSRNLLFSQAQSLTEESETQPRLLLPEIAILSESIDDPSVGGGSNENGGWQTRRLNTIQPPKGTYSIKLELDRNEIRLLAGQYLIEGSAPAFRIRNHLVTVNRVESDRPAGAVIIGPAAFTHGSVSVQTRAFFSGIIDVKQEEERFVIRHFTDGNGPNKGLGAEHTAGAEIPLITTQVKVTKLR